MRDPAFLFYGKDFYEATRTMLPKERACYVDLLIYQHQHEYIPNDLERMTMYCSGLDEATLKAVLEAKFKLCDKGWYNERLNIVMEERRSFSNKQSHNGLIGQFFKKAKSTLKSKEYDKLKQYIYNIHTKEKLVDDLKNEHNYEAMLEAMLEAMHKHLAIVNGNGIIDINKEFSFFINSLNSILGKKFKDGETYKNSFKARINDGYSVEQMLTAIKNAKADKYHLDNGFKYLTPEFILRVDKLERFLNISNTILPDKEYIDGKEIITEKSGRRFYWQGDRAIYIYPPRPDFTGWTKDEIYNYVTHPHYDKKISDLYESAIINQSNTTEAEKKGKYKYFYDQDTLQIKYANHDNVRTS